MYGEKGIRIRQIVKPTWQNLFCTQMPQRSNYKLASSGTNPPDSTLGLAIWQETFWPKSEVVLKTADGKGEGCKGRGTWSESANEGKVREQCNCPRHQIIECMCVRMGEKKQQQNKTADCCYSQLTHGYYTCSSLFANTNMHKDFRIV